MCVSVSVIVGAPPHVTATLAESILLILVGCGPMTNAASPAGGGVRLSRSDGRNPYLRFVCHTFSGLSEVAGPGAFHHLVAFENIDSPGEISAVPAALKT